jgi:hypothetical protein
MPAALIPCPACSRHARAGDPSCPFCRAPLPDGAPVAAIDVPLRASRAALIALGASFGLARCASVYGAPPDTGAWADHPQADAAPLDDTPPDAPDSSLAGAYGGPPPFDAGGTE